MKSLIFLMVASMLCLTSCIKSKEEQAYIGAQENLKKYQLKAPASAVFPPFKEITVTKKPHEAWNFVYVVKGYVDSQNSFGAMVRTEYEIPMIEMGDTWIRDISYK